MRFKTTIKYQEGFKPTSRCRKLRYRECEEIIYTEIEEVKNEHTPTAFICGDSEYRLYKDNLYILTSKKDIMFHMKDKTCVEQLAYFFEKCSTFYGLNQGDNREKMIEKANNYASQYLIIDGVVWKKTGEPRYVVMTFGLGNNHGGTSLSITCRYNPNISNKAYFNAFERDKAIKMALSNATGRGDTESIELIKNCCEIKVLMTEAVKCNPKKDHIE